MVYVISKDGHPLMPTKRYGKVRRMLKTGEAKVVKRCPFTIQLLRDTGNKTQEIVLGVDAGSKRIGVSASTEKEELFAAEVAIRNDIAKNLSARRELRRARRNRKTRYRKARFDNRRRKEGWLAPSVKQKVDSHLKVVEDVHKILPVTAIVIETARFDIQKIKNPDISGEEYQQGDQLGFWNVREYVFFRDGHTCQCCKGKSKDKVLNIHHIESRRTGGNAPNNLVTLCETCHKAYHRGEIELPKSIKRGAVFRDAAFMGVMRWACYERLKELYPDVRMTFGYITKNTRIEHGLEKSHVTDARCIAGHPAATPAEETFFFKKVRCHNRQIHKMSIGKGGYRKRNQAEYTVFGYRLFDKVLYNGEEGFVFARRKSGSFDIRKLDGTKLTAGITYKKLEFKETTRNY